MPVKGKKIHHYSYLLLHTPKMNTNTELIVFNFCSGYFTRFFIQQFEDLIHKQKSLFGGTKTQPSK